MKENTLDNLVATVWNTDKESQVSDYYSVAELSNNTTNPVRYFRDWAERTPETEIEFAEQAAMKLPIRYNVVTKEWHVFNNFVWIKADETIITALLTKLAKTIKKGFDSAERFAIDAIRTAEADGKNEKAAKAIKELRDYRMKPRRPLVSRIQSAAGIKATIALLQAQARLNITKANKDDERYLCFRNGVIDIEHTIETGKVELLPHSWARHSTRMIDFNLDLDATAPDWVKFLDESVGNAEEALYLEKALGASIFGEKSTRRIINIQGAPRSGKSMLISVLSEIFKQFVATPQQSAITTGATGKGAFNARHSMRDARIVLFSEVRGKLDSDFLLAYSGGDKFSAEAKFQMDQSYTPQGTIFIANNVPIDVNKSDGAMKSRLARIHFPHTFDPLDPEHTLDEELPSRLLNQAEGIIARLVNGYLLRLREGIDKPDSMERALAEEREAEDVVVQYIHDMSESGLMTVNPSLAASQCTKVLPLYESFVETLRRQNYSSKDIPKRGDFVDSLKELGYDKVRSDGMRIRGLKLTLGG